MPLFCPSPVVWGDVATWISGVATAGAVIFAVHAWRADVERDRSDAQGYVDLMLTMLESIEEAAKHLSWCMTSGRKDDWQHFKNGLANFGETLERLSPFLELRDPRKSQAMLRITTTLRTANAAVAAFSHDRHREPGAEKKLEGMLAKYTHPLGMALDVMVDVRRKLKGEPDPPGALHENV